MSLEFVKTCVPPCKESRLAIVSWVTKQFYYLSQCYEYNILVYIVVQQINMIIDFIWFVLPNTMVYLYERECLKIHWFY